jgi:NADPH:quinone reductase-like Zn-dependent oxidoreductase
MKAAFRQKYGQPDVLSIREIEKPTPASTEILVKVHAATVNRTDCANLTGKPLVMHLVVGFLKPKLGVTGTDFAGVVEAVGEKVTRFKAGERIWGFYDTGLSSHAQYLAIDENKAIEKIPENISFQQAAASAEGAHYAINFMNKTNIQPHHRVLVNGAAGAIGSAMLQILKAQGVYVTAVCNTKNISLMKSLGADKTIDYTAGDFTQDTEKYHFVFDAVGKSHFAKCKTLLEPGGVYISSELGPYWQNVYLPLVTKFTGDKRVIFPIPGDIPKSLQIVKGLLEQGKFKPVIDRTYPLADIREAFRYVMTGQKTGNVVIDCT